MPILKRARAEGSGLPVSEDTNARDPLGRRIGQYEHQGEVVAFVTSGAEGLRPLVILQSLEFPAWPSLDFCARAENMGYRTVSIRRPGFGGVPALPDIDRQVALIRNFLSDLGSEPCVLVCAGTSNPLGFRLAGDPHIALTVLTNCCFNFNPLAEIKPDWFARSIEQALTNQTGARLALMGMQGAEGLFGKYWVLESFMQKSAGDLAYLRAHRELFSDAVSCINDGLDIHTFIMELRSTLNEDACLVDRCFDGLPVIAVSGCENSESWKSATRLEAERVCVPLHFFESGDALVLYASMDEVLDLITRYV